MRIAIALLAIGDRALAKARTGSIPASTQRRIRFTLALAAAAWAVLVWQHGDATMDMTMASPPIGLRAPLFFASWVIMMVAMMFPTAAPMILTFHRVQAVKCQLGDAFVTTWVFVAAYLFVWACAGIAAYDGVLPPKSLPREPRYHRPLRPKSAV